MTFNCSATDDVALANISLYLTNSSNSSFSLNQTFNFTEVSNSSVWYVNLSNGNYTWNCLAVDSSGNSAFAASNRTILINYTLPLVEEEEEISTSSSNYVIKTYNTDTSFSSIGNNFNLRYNDKINFVVNSTNHTLKMQNFNSTTARVLIQSDPLNVYLQNGTLYEFDLNNDSINDIRVRYDGRNSTGAKIFIQEIFFEEERNITALNKEGNLSFSEVEKDSKSLWVILGFILLVILISLYFYFRYFKKKQFDFI